MSRTALPELGSKLVQDGMAVARAEVRLVKAKVGARVAAAKAGAIFLAAAGLLAILALIGLVVGCVLALATLVGPGYAGLIVFGVLILLAAILGWIGAGRLSGKPAAPSGVGS